MLQSNQMNIRDPFVLPYRGRYYLYGTRGASCWGSDDGTDVYVSKDLQHWEGPTEVFHAPINFWADRNFWAPEVHEYCGAFYLFMSFKAENGCRGTQILKADSPLGPFFPHGNGPVTPRDWECLDGTLYIETDGTPYIVFCHEWTQIHDGAMCACRLKADLSGAAGEPVLLFHASEPSWAARGVSDYVTDGPFFHRTASGQLLLLWSSLIDGNYIQAVSRSQNGKIDGPWTHGARPLFDKDGGHGMLFRTFEGQLMLTMHRPNTRLQERPMFFEVDEKDGWLALKQ